ncbi:MAG: DNA polymerase III subunit chi [Methylophilaceae bacterium]
MTRIIFYFNLDNKQKMLSALVCQALDKKHRVTIMAESEQAASALSNSLWSSGATDFVPNVLATHVLAPNTPVLVDWQEKTLFQDDILINLTQQQLLAFSRFRELIELVSVDEADKTAARQRYKFYRDRGYEIKHIDQANLVN